MNLSHRDHTEPHKIKCRPIVSEQLIEQEQQQEQRQAEDDQDQPLAEEEKQEQPNEKETDIANKEEIAASNSPTADKELLEMISDLTEQINQLKLQMNSMPTDNNNRPEFSFFTLDDQGNVIPGADLAKLFATAKQSQQPQVAHVTINTEKNQQAKEQHENKKAYQQKYIAV
jgi:hypothetical protein